MKTFDLGGTELTVGWDPDPDCGYRVQLQMASGNGMAVFLSDDEVEAMARQVNADLSAGRPGD